MGAERPDGESRGRGRRGAESEWDAEQPEQPGRTVAVQKRRLASWRGPRPQSVEDGCLGKF